eukprot:6688679-Pyramimonas_sp.AAC.1
MRKSYCSYCMIGAHPVSGQWCASPERVKPQRALRSAHIRRPPSNRARRQLGPRLAQATCSSL